MFDDKQESSFANKTNNAIAHRHGRPKGVATDKESLIERASGDEGPFHLDAELLRNIAKGRQVFYVRFDTRTISFVEVVSSVDQYEYPQHQSREERIHRLRQIVVSAMEVRFEVAEQIGENLRVFLIQHAVGLPEHGVKFSTRLVDQI